MTDLSNHKHADVSASEMAALGSVLHDPNALDDIRRHITDKSQFYSREHQELFGAMCELHDAGKHLDIVVLAEKMQGVWHPGGDAAWVDYMAVLAESLPSAAAAGHYAKLVWAGYLDRVSKERMGQYIVSKGEGESGLDKLISDLESLRAKSSKHSDTTHIADAMVSDLDHAERVKRGEVPPPVTTGLSRLDERIGGYEKQRTYTVLGPSGSGKSVFGFQAAVNMARTGPTLVVSMEMSAELMSRRWLTAISDMNQDDFRRPHDCPADAWADARRAVEETRSLPMHICDTPALAHSDIYRIARSFRRSEGDLRGIVVDYIQIAGFNDSEERRDLRVSEFCQRMHDYARLLDCPIVMLSQVNRSVGKSHDGKMTGRLPVMTDASDSAGIEKSSDYVIGTGRPSYFLSSCGRIDEARKRSKEYWISLCKGRDAAGLIFPATWEPHLCRIADWSEHERGYTPYSFESIIPN